MFNSMCPRWGHQAGAEAKANSKGLKASKHLDNMALERDDMRSSV